MITDAFMIDACIALSIGFTGLALIAILSSKRVTMRLEENIHSALHRKKKTDEEDESPPPEPPKNIPCSIPDTFHPDPKKNYGIYYS
jgi:hypothetical protein